MPLLSEVSMTEIFRLSPAYSLKKKTQAQHYEYTSYNKETLKKIEVSELAMDICLAI